jgi:hypothetical protein
VVLFWGYPILIHAHPGADRAAWTTAIATTVLAVAALGALASIWDARRTRHAQIIIDFARRWDDADVNESIRAYRALGDDGVLELVQKIYPVPRNLDAPGPEDRDLADYFKLIVWANVIETAGVLVSMKAINAKAIYKMWGASVASGWRSWKVPVEHMRLYEGHTGAFRHFEQLAAEIDKCTRKEKPITGREVPNESGAAAAAAPDTSD